MLKYNNLQAFSSDEKDDKKDDKSEDHFLKDEDPVQQVHEIGEVKLTKIKY